MTYDPLILTNIVEKETVRGYRRKYFRFRRDRWYGGIVTGDVVGCNLRCKFCWAWRFTWNTRVRGKMLTPQEAFHIMEKKAGSRIKKMRLSGGEPTIGFNHLIRLIELSINAGYHFVIETNGILIGLNYSYAREISRFHGRDIEVRVSIKGASPEEFTRLTGAPREYWFTQLRALENLIEAGLSVGDEVYPAVMLSFSTKENVLYLKEKLREIDEHLPEYIDPEYVILYPHVEYLLKVMKLKPKIAYRPDNVPEELI